MTFLDDKLDREKYADFLTEIIKNPLKYKRISDSKSLCIAIDSSFGTGKSTFLDMWQDKLRKFTGQDESYIIRYNAWKNDFCKNPLYIL